MSKTTTNGIVEVIRSQGGLAVVYHHDMKAERIGNYYADLASYQAAVDQAKRHAKKVGAAYLDNT